MFMCPIASIVWHLMNRFFDIKLKFQNLISITIWLFDFLATASEEKATILTVTLWHIWEARNAARNGESKVHPYTIAERVKIDVEMILLHLFEPPTSHRCEPNISIAKWTPPLDGWMMINIDAVIFNNPPCVGMGAVIRDHFGEFVSASCQKMQISAEPELAEAIAVRFAVLYANELNLDHVVVASDCLNVVSKIKSSMLDRSSANQKLN